MAIGKHLSCLSWLFAQFFLLQLISNLSRWLNPNYPTSQVCNSRRISMPISSDFLGIGPFRGTYNCERQKVMFARLHNWPIKEDFRNSYWIRIDVIYNFGRLSREEDVLDWMPRFIQDSLQQQRKNAWNPIHISMDLVIIDNYCNAKTKLKNEIAFQLPAEIENILWKTKSVIIFFTYLDLLDDVRINHNSWSIQGGVPEIIPTVHKHNKWQG